MDAHKPCLSRQPVPGSLAFLCSSLRQRAVRDTLSARPSPRLARKINAQQSATSGGARDVASEPPRFAPVRESLRCRACWGCLGKPPRRDTCWVGALCSRRPTRPRRHRWKEAPAAAAGGAGRSRNVAESIKIKIKDSEIGWVRVWTLGKKGPQGLEGRSSSWLCRFGTGPHLLHALGSLPYSLPLVPLSNSSPVSFSHFLSRSFGRPAIIISLRPFLLTLDSLYYFNILFFLRRSLVSRYLLLYPWTPREAASDHSLLFIVRLSFQRNTSILDQAVRHLIPAFTTD